MTIKVNRAKDFLIVVDFQRDFVDGSLAVPNAKAVIDPVNKYISKFLRKVFTMDFHPADHMSFKSNGGQWPDHCIAGTPGSVIYPSIRLGSFLDMVVYKGASPDKDAYSGFDGTALQSLLDATNKDGALFICGLATDYCVKFTVLDALKTGRKVYVLADACAAVNVNPVDGEAALTEMAQAGADIVTLEQLSFV